MSRLTKYLESLMTKSDSVKDSQTTHSSYYRIQGLEIGDVYKRQRLCRV